MDSPEVNVDQELVEIYQEINEVIDNELPKEEVTKEVKEEVSEVENKEAEAEQDPEAEDREEPEEAAEYVSDEPSEEDKAKEKGWRPKEEFSGNEKDWVDAPEFNRRTDLFEKIGTQNKTIKTLSKKVEALVNHVQSVESKTREKVIAELKAKQKQAVEYGDTEAYEQAEQALEEATAQKEVAIEAEEEVAAEPAEVPQFLKDFASKNTWFEKDKEMTEYMVYQTQQIVSSEGKSLPEALVIAEKNVKSTFSHKFKNPNKSKPATVMSGSNEARPAKASMSRLTSEQKTVWHALKGTMTEQDFLNQLEELG